MIDDRFKGTNNPFRRFKQQFVKQEDITTTVVPVDIKAEDRNNNNSPFDQIRHEDEQGEYWFARELQTLLGYDKWQRFEDAIERAKISTGNVGNNPGDHFTGAGKMVSIGSGAQREIQDYRLTRYACYLIAMNGDSRKPEIAAAQTYFAVRTRQAEVQEQKLPAMSTMEMISTIALHVDKVEKEQKRQADILKQQQEQQQKLTATIEKQSVRLNRLESQSTVTIRNFAPPDEDVKISINNRVKALAFKRKEEKGGTLGNHVSDIWSDIYLSLRTSGCDIDEELASFKDFWTSQKNRGNKMFTQGKINGFKKIDVISAVPDIRSSVRSILDCLQTDQEENNILY